MSLRQLVQPKRGYLANILTIPPLIYPFQYNPTQVIDSKQVEWEAKTPISPQRGLEGLLGGGAAAVAAVKQQGFLKGVAMTAKTAPEVLGRTFSGAELKKLKSEHDRTLNFKFIVDGREHRPGEPERRRNDDGHILADLAILRSFVYPRLADLLDILGAAFGSESNRWLQLWFNQPPTAILVLGSTSVEGFVTELKITETLFNADLDPVRAEVEVTMIEKIDSLSFIIDSVKRLGRTFYHTAYEDIGDVII
jgi:hypothetical protein